MAIAPCILANHGGWIRELVAIARSFLFISNLFPVRVPSLFSDAVSTKVNDDAMAQSTDSLVPFG